MSTYTPIASQTLSSAAASVTFSGIPQTYTDLVLIVNAKMSANNEDALKLEFNSDTGTNYSETSLYTDVTTPGSSRGTNRSAIPFYNQSTTEWVVTRINIQNYANTTTYKTVLGRNDNAGKSVFATVGLWRSTSAITTIKISPAFAAGSNWVSGSTFNLYGIDASLSAQAKATGGTTIIRDSNYWYHVFTGSGTFTPTQAITADVLVVAGGGGGGRRWDGGERGGGGGGAGGLRLLASQSIAAQSYTVTVGAGGAGATGANPGNGNAGSSTTFNSISVTGGGYGGGFMNAGGSGGSGGGGGRDKTSGSGAGNAGSYSPAEGNNGGTATSGGGGTGCGGGGGAGAAGGNGGSGTAGNGGAGANSYNSISFSSWLTATTTGVSGYLAGGGGGTLAPSGTQGTGGSGGGGAGAASETGNGENAVVNTGSGGGGGGGGAGNPPTTGFGGNGGSGIVIIRYAV